MTKLMQTAIERAAHCSIPIAANQVSVAGKSREREPLGEVVAAWPLAPGALLLLGWQTEAIPAEGVAQLERRRADRGTFRGVSWSRAEAAQTRAFAVTVLLPETADLRPSQMLALQPKIGQPLFACLPESFCDGAAFVAAAAGLAAGHGDVLARFLLDHLPPAAVREISDVSTALRELLSKLAQSDGCIELIGAVPEECVFLQGWGRPHDAAAEILLLGRTLYRSRPRCATFPRSDIMPPATGVVFVLSADAVPALTDIESVYILSGMGLFRADLLDRHVLAPSDSVGHVRGMLAQLRCSPATADCLRAALQPRYEGRDTLNTHDLPVRAAVDVALVQPGVAAFVSGWLYDPREMVASVSLAEQNAVLARLDEGWTRVERPDVTEAFAGDSALAVPTANQPGGASVNAALTEAHGFAAMVVLPGHQGLSSGDLHLAVEITDGQTAYLPVTFLPADPAGREAAVSTVDLHKPSGLAIIQDQLGPFLRALGGRTRRPSFPTRPATPALAGCTQAIVMPLCGAPDMPRAALTQFLSDPLRDHEALMLVCGPTWDRQAADRLETMLRFLGLRGVVLREKLARDSVLALSAAYASCPAPNVLLCDSGIIGRSSGWRDALLAASQLEIVPACASPTLLFEDGSIQYAGVDRIISLRGPPFADLAGPMVGLPVAMADEITRSSPPGTGLTQPTLLASLRCCLVPRSAFTKLGDEDPATVSPEGSEAAFFLRLRKADVRCVWVPGAQVYALGPHQPQPDIAEPGASQLGTTASKRRQVARLADLWRLHAISTQREA